MAHGGDHSGKLLDFSANVSPLGVPEGVLRAVREAAADADRYPDPDCTALRAALAEKYGVPMDWILCGAGAAELIYRACYAEKPERALLPAPSFTEYEAALKAAGCDEIRFFPAGDPITGSGPSTGKGCMLFLCQPNNPTGLSLPPALLRGVLRESAGSGCRVVLDECFLPFTDDPERLTALDCLAEHPHLVILRAFTKLYGMAGLRLGCALSSDAAFLRRMRDSGPPWSVSLVALAAGLAALNEEGYVNRVRALVSSERPRVFALLKALGLSVLPGEANFLLFRGPAGLAERLREKEIAIRVCDDFRGLDARWYRTAIRTKEENDRLIAALREVLL